jgi:hypothetical protein
LEKARQRAQGVRKTRTLYVREEDQDIWDQAKAIVGDSLSTYVTNHLKTLVADKKASLGGFRRIVVKFIDKGIPRAQAFYGRWIIPPDDAFDTGHDRYAVAVTSKGNFVVFDFWDGPSRDDEYFPGSLLVFSSLDEANSKIPRGLIAEVLTRHGIEIEELDI